MSENLTRKRSFIHKDNRNRTESYDLMRKWRIVRLLRQHFDLIALGMVDEFLYCRDKKTNEIVIERNIDVTEEETVVTMLYKYQINRIDLFIKNHVPQRIVEIDELYHGFYDELTTTQQTIDRNANYALGGFTEKDKTLIIITKRDIEREDAELIQILAEKLGVLPKK